MFGREKQQPQPSEGGVVESPPIEETDGRKGRPTPKRKEQQAARRVPLVPADRDAAKKASKEKSRQDRMTQREKMARGDESALPARDRGPIRRFIRNSVDSRLNVGELLLPLALIMLVMLLVPVPALKLVAMAGVWLVVLAGVVDAALMWRRTKREIIERFHEDPPRGSASYAIMRSMQMRMSRLPKPQVARGDKSWKQGR